ncbi:hypothetical protein C2845_PM11G17630 [Panicum miliaceum]|uniref:Wall-associated receptor kinase galacturonan-binding domain-containing protein n=1 Tax=Panicum miliaceum TaxID=4540 RepID=A0A3L6RMC3_PANMI|nr:hypothetical protein C2845_PM11G17630 [Panicum miliaceum]
MAEWLLASGTGRLNLASLSLVDGEAFALVRAYRECNTTAGVVVSIDNRFRGGGNQTIYLSLLGSTTYRLSAARNRFVALGCPNLSYLSDDMGYYVTVCTSVCRPSQWNEVSPGACTGVGCCQSRIPPIIFNENTTACRYAFVAEDKRIETTYSGRPDFNRSDDFAVPVVLDWAIRNGPTAPSPSAT